MRTTIIVGGHTHHAPEEVEGTILQADDGCDYEAVRGRWERFGAPWEGVENREWEPTVRDEQAPKKKVVKKVVLKKPMAAPPRPLNGFSQFMKEALPKIALEHPGMPCKDRMKLAGQMWQAMK